MVSPPGSTARFTCRKAQSELSANRKPTSTSSSRPRAGVAPSGPSVISRGASKISVTRLAAVIASCVIDNRKPSEAIGHTSDSIMVMKATRVPMVTSPWPAA